MAEVRSNKEVHVTEEEEPHEVKKKQSGLFGAAVSVIG